MNNMDLFRKQNLVINHLTDQGYDMESLPCKLAVHLILQTTTEEQVDKLLVMIHDYYLPATPVVDHLLEYIKADVKYSAELYKIAQDNQTIDITDESTEPDNSIYTGFRCDDCGECHEACRCDQEIDPDTQSLRDNNPAYPGLKVIGKIDLSKWDKPIGYAQGSNNVVHCTACKCFPCMCDKECVNCGNLYQYCTCPDIDYDQLG